MKAPDITDLLLPPRQTTDAMQLTPSKTLDKHRKAKSAEFSLRIPFDQKRWLTKVAEKERVALSRLLILAGLGQYRPAESFIQPPVPKWMKAASTAKLNPTVSFTVRKFERMKLRRRAAAAGYRNAAMFCVDVASGLVLTPQDETIASNDLNREQRKEAARTRLLARLSCWLEIMGIESYSLAQRLSGDEETWAEVIRKIEVQGVAS
jgi:hypothetical protein